MNNLKTIILREFKAFPEVEIVILFGSVSRGQLTGKSDIDMAFAAKTITTYEKKMWYNRADMMPKTRMILEKQVKRFINGQTDNIK